MLLDAQVTGATIVRRYWLLLLVLVALGGVVAVRIMQATAPQEPAPTVEAIREARGFPVVVEPALLGPLEVWREYSGSVSGVQDAVVRAQATDRITDVPVRVGQLVRQGQVLVRQASETVEARVRQAETTLRQAERQVTRMRPLHEVGAISDREWEDVLTALEVATADLAAARDPLVLVSPLDGVVTEVPARPGMIPEDGDPLVRVADLSQLLVSLRVSAAQVADIEAGQPARVAGRTVDGQVRRVALQADPMSRLVEVEVAFPPEAGLVLGTLVRVEIQVAAREETITVPREAIRGDAVWIAEDGRAVRRPVETGLETRDRIEVLAGIEPGERVVIEGGSLLSEGAPLQVTE